MPIKIDSVSRVNTCKMSNSTIKKRTEVVDNIVNLHGQEIIKDSKFNPVHALILKLLDEMNPILLKHPKFEEKILKICEKLLKNANSLHLYK